MINKGKIDLLDSIIIDYNLPKHVKPKKVDNGFSIDGENSTWGSISGSSIVSSRTEVLDYLEYIIQNNPSWVNKFRLWAYKKLILKVINPAYVDKKFTINDLQTFFDSLKGGLSELDAKGISDVLESYNLLISSATDNNQIALKEKIVDYINVLKGEIILTTSKFNKFLTEENVVKFYNVASKHEKYKTNLKLTYIKNFVKVIPQEVCELKKQADELKVFDNYVVMHYDYDGKATEDTKAEKQKKKDPILFGLIQNSRKLYYIGDWIDDYCDLTLDVIIKKLGKKNNPVTTVTPETIITDLNKI
jgi:hypothetical protein